MASEILQVANDEGVAEVFVASKRISCIGAAPPHDHPHIYLEMGDDNDIICPYCSTKYIYKK